jgi:threonine dehydratase
MPVTLADIQAARSRIADAIYHSPCPYSLSLSQLCGCEVYCKLDHLQMTGSFKERGARNRLLLLTPEQKQRGVIAASAGNHALGLAYHGKLLGVPVTVVMPKWAPLIKVSNARSFGANVILHGESFHDARTRALELAEQEQLTFVPAFDDPHIIAGQGTLGLEILEDLPDVDAVISPVGGGGLISGIATVIKALKPHVRIVGVEPANAPTVHTSLERGEVTRIDTQPTLADGLAVAEVGRMCFEVIREKVDQVVLVDEEQIALSILRLLEMEKTVVEGAGAVPLAAALRARELGLEGKKVVLVLCGGNIDVTLVSRIIERGLAADGRLCRIVAQISDRPGSLAKLLSIIAATGASVKEVEHDRHFGTRDVALVSVVCTVETRDLLHINELADRLHDAGVRATIEPKPAPPTAPPG